MKTLSLARSDGGSLALSTIGPVSGAAVLFLHGGGQTRHAWSATARALSARGFYCISMDLRGHGDSSWSEARAYRDRDFADDLAVVARHVGRPVVGVGASLGGLVLLSASTLTRESVAGVVLVDIAPKMEPAGFDRIVTFMKANPDGFATVEDAADAIAAYLPHRKRPTDLSGLAKNLRRRPDGRFRWHWDPAILDVATFAGDADLGPLQEAARRLTVPTLLVRGALSDLLSDDGVRDFLSLAPHAEYVDVRGAHHMVVGDQNDAFTDAVAQFLLRRFHAQRA